MVHLDQQQKQYAHDELRLLQLDQQQKHALDWQHVQNVGQLKLQLDQQHKHSWSPTTL
jgi:hypothetical protein